MTSLKRLWHFHKHEYIEPINELNWLEFLPLFCVYFNFIANSRPGMPGPQSQTRALEEKVNSLLGWPYRTPTQTPVFTESKKHCVPMPYPLDLSKWSHFRCCEVISEAAPIRLTKVKSFQMLYPLELSMKCHFQEVKQRYLCINFGLILPPSCCNWQMDSNVTEILSPI